MDQEETGASLRVTEADEAETELEAEAAAKAEAEEGEGGEEEGRGVGRCRGRDRRPRLMGSSIRSGAMFDVTASGFGAFARLGI